MIRALPSVSLTEFTHSQNRPEIGASTYSLALNSTLMVRDSAGHHHIIGTSAHTRSILAIHEMVLLDL